MRTLRIPALVLGCHMLPGEPGAGVAIGNPQDATRYNLQSTNGLPIRAPGAVRRARRRAPGPVRARRTVKQFQGWWPLAPWRRRGNTR